MTITIPFQPVQAYRASTFRTQPGQRIYEKEEAVRWVNERGFIYFWPITGILLPSLWGAVAGDRPVADEHDDPGHITWGWKDGSLGGRDWYYAKVLRKKATMISFELAPYFYALSENYGSPEEDYLTLYEQGRMTQESRAVYEALLDHGVLDTIELRKVTRMTSTTSDSRFNKALTDLQADFKILPVAVTQSGAWHYAFAYNIVARHYPELPQQAEAIGERQARHKLTEAYLRSIGAARPADVRKLFGWRPAAVEHTLNALAEAGVVERGVHLEGQPGEWVTLREFQTIRNEME
jgi:hypothetical protein